MDSDPSFSSSFPIMSSDLGLDPSDPLNLLLHNHSQRDPHDTDTDEAGTPPDWSTLSNMWPPVDDPHSKLDFSMDMDFGLMDMTFDPAVGIEPNALNYAYAAPDPFQFTFESPHTSSRSSSESGSTSGSFSPLVAYSPPPLVAHSPPASEADDDPATELASRVRKSAGLVLAVPIHPDYQQQQQAQPPQEQAPSFPTGPPAFTTTPVPPPAQAAATSSASARPKTSHTTIERRYRTNLNARIQSLRAAVPALRVVDRAAALKAGLPAAETDEPDIVDARGFVDGVKVARKCSKATVLGKAVEYIRVLKRREHRLSRELAGLKTLLGGLVGGEQLLRAWEREWAARFGGPETDELGADGVAPPEDDGDEDDEESDDDGAGRKRKKPKVEPKPKPERKPPAAPAEGGEKKKRGRPRKVVPLPAATLPPPPALSTSVPLQTPAHVSPPPQQYLLAAFALFSFFANANVSAPPPAHAGHHAGHVLTRAGPAPVQGLSLVQAFHLLASAAVLASVLVPLGKSVYGRLRAAPAAAASSTVAPAARIEKSTALVATDDSASDTESDLSFSRSSTSFSSDDEPLPLSALRPAQAEAEACILDATTPLPARLLAAFRLYSAPVPSSSSSSSSSSTDVSADDRHLLALLLFRVPLLGRRLAARLWDARALGVPVEEATRRVARASFAPEKADSGVLRALAEGVAAERLRAAAAQAFVRAVLPSAPASAASETDAEMQEREAALAAARALGGRVGVLGARVGSVLGGGGAVGLAPDSPYEDVAWSEEDEDEGGDSTAAADTEKLLRALVLYRRVFGASASPTTTVSWERSALRRALGSSAVFEAGAVEEARDCVVDLLTGAS
ncbi:hypothetical protein B0H15DRAFT_118618 [Mycena belliarum]|uniref:BHLH domain-containing protein n=1 Tax=Mycena belliarum TaxID=1033014 RepID=A0AAD6TQG1_9AGAR|nr:hypothetical protein B0H15DRAFT_118618 [Mycena belliae]